MKSLWTNKFIIARVLVTRAIIFAIDFLEMMCYNFFKKGGIVMKLFLLQKEEESGLEVEYTIIKTQILSSLQYKIGLIDFEEISCADLRRCVASIQSRKYKDAFPIGNLQFVGEWMRLFHNKSVFPIEIPTVLRRAPFVKREYKIVHCNELPSSGRYFIKDVSVVKGGTFHGDIETFKNDFLDKYQRSHSFLVSSIVDVLSEWRVYVINGEIEHIAHYDGDCLALPDKELISDAVKIYSNEDGSLGSYTIDLMVSVNGTEIIEVHPFVSVGLYNSIWDDSLLDAYIDGIKYYLSK